MPPIRIERSMTRRAKRALLGLLLLILAAAYPVASWIDALTTAQAEPADQPLTVATTFTVPLKKGQLYFFEVMANGNDLNDAVGCLLSLPDPYTQPAPCPKTAAVLHFHYRLLDSAGRVVSGDYGRPFEGDYPDRENGFQASVSNGEGRVAGGFHSFSPQQTAADRFEISRLELPAALAAAQPRLHVYAESNMYAAFTALPMLLLSALLLLAAVILLTVAAFTRAKHASSASR